MALVSFKRGTKPQDVSSLSGDTIYFFSDTKEIYLGSTPYAGDLTELLSKIEEIEGDLGEAQNDIESAQSDITSLQAWMATHKTEYSTLNGKYETLVEEVAKKLESLAAGDASIKIGGSGNSKTVAVAISEASGNALSLANDGLKVTVPAATDYTVTVTEQGTPETGYAKTYVIAQEATELNAKINIPKDLVVSKGEIVKNNGSTDGTFIKLTLNNDDVLYIDVADLVDTVEANNGDSIVTVTVTDGNKIGASIANKAITSVYLADAVNADIKKGTDAYDALTWGTI